MFLSILIDLAVSAGLSALLLHAGQLVEGSLFLDANTRLLTLAVTALLLALVWLNCLRAVLDALRRRKPDEPTPVPEAAVEDAEEEDGLYAPVESDSFETEDDLPLPPPEPLVLRAISVVPPRPEQPG